MHCREKRGWGRGAGLAWPEHDRASEDASSHALISARPKRQALVAHMGANGCSLELTNLRHSRVVHELQILLQQLSQYGTLTHVRHFLWGRGGVRG